jgi:hypothetical protein
VDQVSSDIKFVLSRGLVSNNNLISNLRTQVFIICKKSVYKNKEFRYS